MGKAWIAVLALLLTACGHGGIAVNGDDWPDYGGGPGAAHFSPLAEIDTGKPLWQYDSRTRETAGAELRGAWGSRGMAFANGRVFVGTLDGRLIALDAKTGAVQWTAQTTTTTKGDGDGRQDLARPVVALRRRRNRVDRHGL